LAFPGIDVFTCGLRDYVITRFASTLGELEKILHVFSNSIDYEILGQGGMSFEKSFKILVKESIIIMLRTNMI